MMFLWLTTLLMGFAGGVFATWWANGQKTTGILSRPIFQIQLWLDAQRNQR